MKMLGGVKTCSTLEEQFFEDKMTSLFFFGRGGGGFCLRKNGSETKNRTKEEEIARVYGSPTRKVLSFFVGH